ncbi:MAG: hypothetical protein E7431_00505 [Ruminococcaceae bacterium]|nr:hypothetical protein [Oscillospiraceae bacterium]
MGKKPKNTTSTLTRKHIWGYGMGDAGACMTFAIVSMYATRYYINVLKIDTTIMATILLIWNIWDAVNDPLMGALMDKVFAKNRNPKGKFRPWLMRSTPLIAVTAIIFFTVPTFFEGTTMLVVLFFCKIAYEASYTMFNIPMGSLLSSMAKNDEERAQLSSARGFGSTVSSLVPVMTAPLILSYFGDTNPTAYMVCSVIFAAVGFVMCLLHCLWTEERSEPVAASQSDADKIKVTDILGVFKNNRAFLALCLHSVCICTQQSVATSLGTYMYSDVLGNLALMSLASLLSMPLAFVFLGLAPKMAKKFGLEGFIRHGLMIGTILYVALFVMHLVMNVPAVVHLVWSAVAGSFVSISTQQQYGLVGESIDYNEYLTGKRTEGSIYGTFSLSRRVGTTIGNSLGVLMLGWIGYDANLAVQAASTLTGIKVLCVLLPGIFALGSWLAFRFVWNITPEVREKMRAAAEAKKVAAE